MHTNNKMTSTGSPQAVQQQYWGVHAMSICMQPIWCQMHRQYYINACQRTSPMVWHPRPP